jgi:hypothetical protein
MKVWCIYYTVRQSSYSKWRKTWTGPCGIYDVDLYLNSFQEKLLSGLPIFFKTRKSARLKAKELDAHCNKTWIWVKHIVRPVELTWEEIK